MAISLYFGLPGCGKTTMLCMFAVKNIKKGVKVYGNIPLAVPGYTQIDNSCIGRYNLENCLILIDEGTLFADSRDYKEFDHKVKSFFLLHRHYRVDVIFFSQEWASLDKRIRAITDRVFFCYKTPLLGQWFTNYYRVPYGIIIPDPKKDTGSSQLGEIVQGYCKPGMLQRLLCHRCFRPRYYKFFDSWQHPYLPPLPPIYKPYGVSEEEKEGEIQ